MAASAAATVTSKASKSASHHVAPVPPPGDVVARRPRDHDVERPVEGASVGHDPRQVGRVVGVDQEHAVVPQRRATGRRFGHRAASQMGIPPGRAGAGRKVTSSTE